jgi:hypothetical protein
MPSKEAIGSLLKRSGPFLRELESLPNSTVKLANSLESAVPLPFRRFIHRDLREGAFAYVWREAGALNFLALMEDSNAFSEAGPKQDLTWMKGDVMELFLQPAGGSTYFEFHVAPNGATLELKIPSIQSFREDPSGGFESRFFESDMESAHALFDGDPFKGWAGLLSVPFEGRVLGGSVQGAKFSVCRYNYNKSWGERPELSSTSKYTRKHPSFHDPESWPSLLES